MAVTGAELMQRLEELIAALDARVHRVEQAGELAIARDAAALRAKAVRRLEELAALGPVELAATTDRPTRRKVGEPR
jgi:hypothetical protein